MERRVTGHCHARCETGEKRVIIANSYLSLSQLMHATALVRFWTLAMLAYVFLEHEQRRVPQQWQRRVSIGQARREIQRRHRRLLLLWLFEQFQSGVHPDSFYDVLAA